MKDSTIKVLLLVFVIHSLFTISFLTTNSYAAILDIDPDYGDAPEIDGEIDRSNNEWKNATKEIIYLKSLSSTDKGIRIDLLVMQNGSNLYISVQFELEAHKSTEFIGILISESNALSNESFTDAKVLQFTNLGEFGEKFVYRDYYIINNQFFEDRDAHGDAAAELVGNKIIYEFEIPINKTEDAHDVSLDYGEKYAFKIVYGEEYLKPGSFIKSDIILINIEYPPEVGLNIWILIHNILCIIIFCGLSLLFALYTYKIIVIKKKIRRIA